jgi:signal transduction histidine kinase
VRGGKPIVIPRFSRGTGARNGSTETEVDSFAMVIPVGHAGAPIGALFVLGETGAHIRSDEMARARTFGHLAALAYEKVWLLNAARERREELERVMKSRSGLMRGFSHDVKNPLGAADGYAELLSTDMYGQLSANQKDIVDRIRHLISRALGLIDQINTLARAETGRLELTLEPVDLGELVRSAGEEYRAAARNRGLALSVDVTAAPPTVETDGARVRQIIGNLMSNAIKYTEAGSVTLRVQQHPSGPVEGRGHAVAIDVIDTGPGIPSEKQAQVFDEFVRLAGAEKPGTGLGLAISRRLAHALRGEITLESEPGRGSTFTLWLPSVEALVGEHRQIET